MHSRRTRLLAPVLLTTAGLAVAGCGGGGGGDKDAYVKTYDTGCKKLTTALSDLRTDASSGASASDSGKVFAPAKKATIKFFGTVKTEFKTLADADAPDEFSDFQDKFKDAAGKLIDQVDKASGKVESAKDLAALGKALSNFGSLKLQDAKVPDALTTAAPACKTLDSGGAAAG